MSVSPSSIRSLFLQRQPSYSASEAADVLAMWDREMERRIAELDMKTALSSVNDG